MMDFDEERYFILQLMKFVTETTNKNLPYIHQQLLDEFSKDRKSNLTKNIKNAIKIHIGEYLDRNETPINVGTLYYKKKLLDINTPEVFLQFIGFYAKKSVFETLKVAIDSSYVFYSSFTDLSENFRKMDNYSEFLKKLDEAATRFVSEDRKNTMNNI